MLFKQELYADLKAFFCDVFQVVIVLCVLGIPCHFGFLKALYFLQIGWFSLWVIQGLLSLVVVICLGTQASKAPVKVDFKSSYVS